MPQADGRQTAWSQRHDWVAVCPQPRTASLLCGGILPCGPMDKPKCKTVAYFSPAKTDKMVHYCSGEWCSLSPALPLRTIHSMKPCSIEQPVSHQSFCFCISGWRLTRLQRRRAAKPRRRRSVFARWTGCAGRSRLCLEAAHTFPCHEGGSEFQRRLDRLDKAVAALSAKVWCPRRDSNSHDSNSRRILSPLRLPIPPLGPAIAP